MPIFGGSDFPQKMLIWESAEGAVKIAYDEPEYLSSPNNISCDGLIAKISKASHQIAGSTEGMKGF